MASNTSSTPATNANQTLTGTTGADRLSGGGGNDTITTGAGNDVISGDGPLSGQWTYGVYNRDFSSANGQAPTITQGTLIQQGYVDDFNVGTLSNTARGTTGDQSDFGMLYRSTLNVSSGGTYRIATTSDDGSTVIIRDANGNQLNFANQTGGTLNYMNNDFHQAATTRYGDVVLQAGQSYTIEVRFWENQGQNTLAATIRGPDTGNATQNLLTSGMIGVPPTLTGTGQQPGNDVIDAGAGSDIITTGGGEDFISGNSFGGGAGTQDTITDFDPALDKADLSGFYTRIKDVRDNVQIVNGNAILTLPDGATVVFQNVGSRDALTASNTLVPCFTPGTMIDTPHGARAVETLRAGDLVVTDQNGLQPIAWVGQRDLSPAELAAAPNLAPVVIRKGAFGPDLPTADLTVSPQHRILLSGYRIQMIADHAAAFAAAVSFLKPGVVDRRTADAPVSYIHLMFDRHQVVRANGLAAESLLPSRAAVDGFAARARAELVALFPDLAAAPRHGIFPVAHPILTRSEARCVLAG